MNNKKLIQIIVICVVAVWLFCITFTVGVLKVRKQNEQVITAAPLSTGSSYSEQSTTQFATQPSIQPTTQPSQITETGTISSQEQPSSSEPQSIALTEASTSYEPQQTTEAKPNVPSTKAEIIQTYIQAVNKLKGESDFTLVKTEKLAVSISEMTPSSAMNMANKMIQNNTQDAPETFRFSNGFDASSGMSPTNVIAPLGKQASLNESIVTNAEATPDSNGGINIKLSLGSETQTLDRAAPNYSTSMQVIQLETLGLPSNAKFDSLTINYDNSTIEAAISSDGRITSMKHFLNVSSAEGSGSIVFPITAKLNGNFTSEYQIAY